MGAAEVIVIVVVLAVVVAAIVAGSRAGSGLRTSTTFWIAATLVAVLVALADLTSDDDNAGKGAGKVLLVWVVLSVLLLAYRGVTGRQEQQTTAVATSGAVADVDALEKLAALRDRGVLTEAEYETKKAQLL